MRPERHSQRRPDARRSGGRSVPGPVSERRWRHRAVARGLAIIAAGSLLAGWAAVPLPAAEAVADDKLADMDLDQLMQTKVSTVVGASKHEQHTSDAPSAVSIVTADDIKKHGHRTLGDILRSVSGFYVTYDRGYSFIGVRGVNRPGDYGGRLLLMVDGHRVNDALYDTAASHTDFILDVDLIDRVEVIRGPGSSLYGNNAFFGVINVITRRGRDLDGAEVAGVVASFNSYSGRVSYGQRWTNGLEFALSGSLYDTEGQEALYFAEYADRNNGIAEDLDGGWARSAFASLSWRGLSLEGGFIDRKKQWPTAAYQTVFNDPHYFTIDERAFVDLKFHHAFENDWEVQARGYCDHYRFDGEYPYDYGYPDVTLNRDYGRAQSVGAEVQVSKTLWDQHRLTAGGEYRYDFQLDQRNFDVEPPEVYLDSEESASLFGLFLQDEWQIRTNLILNAGLRYDHFDTFGDTVNPRAALIHRPWSQTTFKALYGQAFRAPNAYENYYESFINRRNDDLAPETIRSGELVCEQACGSRWHLNGSLFLNQIEDLIGYQEAADGSGYYFDNIDAVLAYGTEVGAEFLGARGLRARASYTFCRAVDEATDHRLSNSPEHLGKLNLIVPLWRDRVFGSLEVQATSARRLVAGGETSGFWLVHATLFSRELLKGLDVSASVYNLLDTEYADPVPEDFTPLRAVGQDGRTFRIKLTYRF